MRVSVGGEGEKMGETVCASLLIEYGFFARISGSFHRI